MLDRYLNMQPKPLLSNNIYIQEQGEPAVPETRRRLMSSRIGLSANSAKAQSESSSVDVAAVDFVVLVLSGTW